MVVTYEATHGYYYVMTGWSVFRVSRLFRGARPKEPRPASRRQPACQSAQRQLPLSQCLPADLTCREALKGCRVDLWGMACKLPGPWCGRSRYVGTWLAEAGVHITGRSWEGRRVAVVRLDTGDSVHLTED